MQTSRNIDGLGQAYLNTVNFSLRQVDSITAQLGLDKTIPLELFSQLLNTSAVALVERWKTGRKVLRTQIAVEMIYDYPETILQTSLFLDATINLLDDLLDEELTQDQRGVYILEMVRILALMNALDTSPAIREKISSYFNKCICIVIPEIVFKRRIREATSFDERFAYSIQCYDAKSLDMDVFVELPLVQKYGNDDHIDDIVRLARSHRAVALIKKDYHDLEHDRTNGTETPMLLLSEEGPKQLHRYMTQLFEHYLDRSKADPTNGDEHFAPYASKIRVLIERELEGR